MKRLIVVLTEGPDGRLYAHMTMGDKQATIQSEEPDPEDRELQKSIKASNFYQALRCGMQADFSPETCEEGFKESCKLFL